MNQGICTGFGADFSTGVSPRLSTGVAGELDPAASERRSTAGLPWEFFSGFA